MATGTILINAERCKGCELCTTACPKDLIVMDEALNAKGYHPAKLVDPNHTCTGCSLCAVMCPDAVITVFREIKSAAPAASA